MCCLFGMVDYGHVLSQKRKHQILTTLAAECEVRGTDASGIAYNSRGVLHIYKRPVPAHRLGMALPPDAAVVMGHTRMTTQGNAKRNCNNHPFRGVAGQIPFALAHNGILHNDDALKRQYRLPDSKIQTDSYVSAQLLEKKHGLDWDALRFMAEHLEGSFTITILDGSDNLYFIKGNNPLCLLDFPRLGFYLYASTEEILRRALDKLRLGREKQARVPADCGELLKISPNGEISRSTFDDRNLFLPWYGDFCSDRACSDDRSRLVPRWDEEYLAELRAVASSFGYAPEDIDTLLQQGFSPEDVEDFLYCGEC
ncbi:MULTISPECIES: class II glutamine amidotransferase [Oscillibacter]|uniref:class II glutamine amidotransferase n=1 Tax=unclassified Oscillibacter TaxID=2629304 RepID=UPI00260028AC|nr:MULTISPECIES: hypothetical protein [unclassified Oscillibacter]